jgi:PAS domain S-box-containing protein
MLKPDEPIDFQVLFDSLPMALVVLNFNLEIVEMNKAYLDVTKRSREALIGRSIFDAFPAEGESRRALQASMERARDGHSVDVLPMLAYPITVDDRVEERYWSCSHIPIRNTKGEVAYVVQNTQDVSDLKKLKADIAKTPAFGSEATLKGEVLRRAETVQAINRTLLAETHLLHSLFMKAPSFMCVLSGPEHVFELLNVSFSKLIGERDVFGKAFKEAVPEIAGQEFLSLLDTVYRTGEPFVGRKMRLILQTGVSEISFEHYLDFVLQPILSQDGEVTGIFVDGSDVTEHVLTEQRQVLLIRELHHRVRNTLATVQGVMNSTARTAQSIEEYQDAFAGRIASLARTHAILTEEIQQFVSFVHLLTQELGPYSDAAEYSIVLAGPAVELPSQIAVPLGMTIHELTTNAVKFGALGKLGGSIEVNWDIIAKDGRRALSCEWRERDGPPVTPPARQGFGSILLHRVLSQQIGAAVHVDFPPEGFHLRMVVPIEVEST